MKRSLMSQKGFTIVELLIVIVVIAILAAISVVAYNGIQARAKTSSAQSLASQTAKKAELYNTEVGYYPVSLGSLTAASSTASYRMDGIVASGTLTNNSATNAIGHYVCGTGSPASVTAITTSNVSGGRIYYRDYQNSTNLYIPVGTVSGAGVACYYAAY